jgi:hypothetical protein
MVHSGFNTESGFTGSANLFIETLLEVWDPQVICMVSMRICRRPMSTCSKARSLICMEQYLIWVSSLRPFGVAVACCEVNIHP